ncbi:histidine phosphatase family protein [Desertibaculum subflavum]|uniref:histidine phosphatase family protein n=1 Tax=Desertibaculum subflavum TaxID=2268458 RepID=UPI000E6752F2
MPRIHLIRHGRAAAGFGEAVDPGLDDLGRQQAEAVAARWTGRPAIALAASPLRRTQETAAPLARAWSAVPRIEPRIAEIPSPGLALAERATWLAQVMQGRWAEQADELRAWRDDVVRALLAMPADTVAFSHFIAINAAASAAMDDDRVIVFRPDYCSETVLEHDGARLRVVQFGAEAETTIR